MQATLPDDSRRHTQHHATHLRDDGRSCPVRRELSAPPVVVDSGPVAQHGVGVFAEVEMYGGRRGHVAFAAASSIGWCQRHRSHAAGMSSLMWRPYYPSVVA